MRRNDEYRHQPVEELADEELLFDRRQINISLQCGVSSSHQVELVVRQRKIDAELAKRRANIAAAQERIEHANRNATKLEKLWALINAGVEEKIDVMATDERFVEALGIAKEVLPTASANEGTSMDTRFDKLVRALVDMEDVARSQSQESEVVTKAIMLSLALAGCDWVFLGVPPKDFAPDALTSDARADAPEAACYRVVTTPTDPITARANCAATNQRLVEIFTPEQNERVRALAPQTIMVGLFDTDEDDVFTWASGAPITFTNWYTNQPDDTTHTQSCVVMIDGLWFDYNCEPRSFVCACEDAQ